MYNTRFTDKYKYFLATTIEPCVIQLPLPNISLNPGRPSLSYNVASERSKRRKVSEHLENNTPTKVIDSAIKALKPEYDDIQLLIDYMNENNLKVKEIIDILIIEKNKKENDVYQCLKLFYKCNMSVNSYKVLRKNQVMHNQKTLQPYYKLAMEKLNCIPNSLFVNDYMFHVNSAELVLLTTKRILLSKCNFDDFKEEELNVIEISAKCGIDGAQSASEYCHKFSNEQITDKYFTVSTMVLLSIKFNGNEIYLCQNPNSINNTRPLFFTFEQESPELTKNLFEKIQSELVTDDHEFFIEYKDKIYR